MVFVNEGKEPVTAFFGVAPTFNDAGAALGLVDDFVFGEDDTAMPMRVLGKLSMT